MIDLERRDIQYLIDALKRVEWADVRDETAKCPVCHRPKAWGHVCSCPVGLGIRKVGPRLVGTEQVDLPDVQDLAEKYEQRINWGDDTLVGGIAAAITEALTGCGPAEIEADNQPPKEVD